MRVNWRRAPLLLVAIVLLAATVVPTFQWQTAYADQIINRSLTLQAGDNVTDYDANTDNVIDGGSQAGGIVDHLFEFTVPTTATAIGSIQFQYCTTASGSEAEPGCTLPTGVVTTSAEIGLEDLEFQGFTIDSTVNGTVTLNKTSASAPGAGNGDLSFRLDKITNPSAVNETFFVRISTFEADGTLIDDGTVAASTATQIVLSGVMPESLIFCAGENIDLVNNVPDCGTATSGDIAFPELFSPTNTATATSELAASTNALNGYTITVNGSTLTSGSNTIDAMAAAGSSNPGTSQFGMNLVANTILNAADAPLGADITPASNISDTLMGQAAGDYALPDTFKFISGEVIANSGFGDDISSPTNGQIYTASYIVNVPGAQPAGTYTTTLTYICTPTF